MFLPPEQQVTLLLLRNEDTDVLTELALEKSIWTYALRPYDDRQIFLEKWLAKAFKHMQEGTRMCFTVWCAGQIVGSTSYYDIDDKNKTMKIGYTWFHPVVWGTQVNALSKLILFKHAFETMRFNRVGFSVDSLNIRSCRALEKLGVKREGILRREMILPNGRVRDSLIYSVIREEWPEVKAGLLSLVEDVRSDLAWV